MRLFGTWSQVVRDEAFLVEMRLQNLEPGQDGKTDAELDLEFAGVDEE